MHLRPIHLLEPFYKDADRDCTKLPPQLPTFKSNKCGSISDRGPVNSGLTQLFPIPVSFFFQTKIAAFTSSPLICFIVHFLQERRTELSFAALLWNDCFYLFECLNSLETHLYLINRETARNRMPVFCFFLSCNYSFYTQIICFF